MATRAARPFTTPGLQSHPWISPQEGGGRETVFGRPFFADITPGAEHTRFWAQMKATRRQKKRTVVAHKPARALTRPVRSQTHVRSHVPQKKEVGREGGSGGFCRGV